MSLISEDSKKSVFYGSEMSGSRGKVVLCEFGDRRKRIVIECSGADDLKSLENAFAQSSNSDPDLLKLIENARSVTFQIFDADFNVYRDIESDEAIDDKSVVKVIFNPVLIQCLDFVSDEDACSEVTKKEVFRFKDTDSSNNQKDSPNPVLPCPQKTKNSNNGDAGSSKNTANIVPLKRKHENTISELCDLTEESASCSTPVTSEQPSNEDSSDENDIDDPDYVSTKPSSSNSNTSTEKKKKIIGATLPDPPPLPTITKEVQDVIDAGNLVENMTGFMSICTQHLCSLTDGWPSKKDYRIYSMTICSKYEQLKDDAPVFYATFKSQLSASIRNRRAYAKSKVNKKNKTSKFEKKLQGSASCPVGNKMTSASEEPNISTSMLEQLHKELKKVTAVNEKTITHVKMLLEKTLESRKKLITNETDPLTCSAVLKEYPCFNNFELVSYELQLINFRGKEVDVNGNLEKVFSMLSALFKKPGNTDKENLKLLTLAEDALRPNKKDADLSVIRVHKVNENLRCLQSQEKECPRMDFFLDGSVVRQAFVVADKTVRIAVTDGKIVSALTTLFGLYYMCDLEYPKAYTNILKFLDFKVMGVKSSASVSITLSKFLKSLK